MKLARSLLALILLALLAAPQNAVLAAESVLFVQPAGGVPVPAPVNGSNYPLVDCPACTGAASPTGANNADGVASVATGLGPQQDFLFGYNGTTWDRLRVDGSKNLDINCVVGCSGGTFNNNADGIATSATNGQSAAWLYGYNGTTWDRVRVDSNKYLDVNVQISALPSGASTSALQSTGNTALTTINTTLGTPMQASGGTVGISGTLPAFAATPTVKFDQTTDGSTNAVTVKPTATAGAGITPVVSTAVESNHVFKAGAGNFYSAYITTGASAGFFMIADSASAPTAGGAAIAPIHCIQVAANSSASISTRGGPPDVFATGITAVFSTTGCFTNTASATAFFSGDVK